MEHKHVTVSPEAHAQLRLQAAIERRAMYEVAEQAILEYIERQKGVSEEGEAV